MATQPHDAIAAAREFYRETLRESFYHTRLFAEQTHRLAQGVVDTPAFDAILRDSSQGTLDASRRIGEMAVVHLDTASDQPGPWWRDLCSYERAYFLQLSTTDPGPPTNRPRRGVSALCTNFNWNMPELLKRLKSGVPVTDDLRRAMTLLFSRGPQGKIFVVEVGAQVEKVFRATNGLRTLDQIATTAGVSLPETQQVLNALAGIGAAVLAQTPEQMMDAIRAKQQSQ